MTCHTSSYGPRFGSGSDIFINDDSNVKDNLANICYVYGNNKYKYGDK
jgi:hypothetical protein